MRVDHLTSSVTTEGGGIPVALQALVCAQRSAGILPRVLGWDEGGKALTGWPEGALLSFPMRRRAGVAEAIGMKEALSGNPGDLLHVHGLWTGASKMAPSSRRPYLVSPHGMLDSWALGHSRWKKRLAALSFENRNLRGATCLHALCGGEAKAMRDYGLVNPVAIIPNGIDLPGEASDSGKWKEQRRERALLFLGRLHPKKGLVNALKAWAKELRPRAFNWQFVIAGWDQAGHQAELMQLCDELGLAYDELSADAFTANRQPPGGDRASVIFVGPAFGEQKDALLRRASAFILPSFSEGLPMAVLEAWAYQLPVLMTDHCNLPEGFAADAAIRIGTDVASIGTGISSLFSFPCSALDSMAASGRKLVSERFSWPKVAAQMKEVYEWVLGSGEVPGCVLK